MMKYWLLKSEPNVWSIDQQEKAGKNGVVWDGVRNYQAANNLKKMTKGDLCFFYHSNIGKEIVGIVEVIKTAFIDNTDKTNRFVSVKVKFKKKLNNPVTLKSIKNNTSLKGLALITSLKDQSLRALDFSNLDNVKEAIIFEKEIGRIRDIKIHPDNGKLFFLAQDKLWLFEKK